MAIICPYNTKCACCKHSRPDPDRNGEYSCFLKVDLEQENKEKEVKKMKVYVVLTSNVDEEPCELEGVYSTRTKAAAKLREIKENWKEYAGDDIDAEEDEEDYYAIWTSCEVMEAKIIEQEVE